MRPPIVTWAPPALIPKINGLSTLVGALLELAMLELDGATLDTGAWLEELGAMLELLCAARLDELGVVAAELLVFPADDVFEPPSQADSMLANAVAQITAEGLFTKRISEYLLFFFEGCPSVSPEYWPLACGQSRSVYINF